MKNGAAPVDSGLPCRFVLSVRKDHTLKSIAPYEG